MSSITFQGPTGYSPLVVEIEDEAFLSAVVGIADAYGYTTEVLGENGEMAPNPVSIERFAAQQIVNFAAEHGHNYRRKVYLQSIQQAAPPLVPLPVPQVV